MRRPIEVELPAWLVKTCQIRAAQMGVDVDVYVEAACRTFLSLDSKEQVEWILAARDLWRSKPDARRSWLRVLGAWLARLYGWKKPR